jgi:small subunit ribosomal protein S1
VNLAEVVPLQQERDFLIIREANADGQVTVSLKELELKKTWDDLLEIHESGKSLSVRVTGVNKGGITVDVEGLRGFIPRSHVMARENLAALIGQRVSASFLEINQENNKLVLSERLVAQANRASDFTVGQLVEGTISSIKPFGVFVDLDGATALLHIKQVSQSFINNLTDLFKPNQPIKAVVIEVDEWKGRIALATKVLENYPGELVEKFSEVMADAEQRAKKVNQKAAEATAAEG